MRSKRVLSVLLAACMLLSLLPTVTWPALAAPLDPGDFVDVDPSYTRVRAPEVAIFNAYTGASEDFFKSQMGGSIYNAVAAGKFTNLKYDTKVSDNTTYVWDQFYDSSLAYLSDKYQQLQAGYAITRTSKSHTHRWQLIYSADLTSYLSSDLYLNDEANRQYWSVAGYTGFSRSATTARQGNKEFHPLGYTINGTNSRYMTVNGVNQSNIRKKMYINFSNRSLYYDGQKKTCTCGGTATGAMVSFYDGTAPAIQSVEIKKGNTPCTNFKAGDTITVVLNCSEAIRFADDSPSGKGNVYIGLQVNAGTDRLPAYLTGLNEESLTFKYYISENDKNLYTITGIDLTSAPNGATALVHKNADITLRQVYGGGNYSQFAIGTYTANKPANVTSELGFTKTTSYVTDMAGNALVNSIPPTSFYIDCEAPFVAKAGLSANTNNGDQKESLDASDLYLGVGDSFALTLYMNEVVTGTDATVTTNVKQNNNTYLTLGVTSSGTTAANGIGDQYGKGASNGQLTFFRTDPVEITDGMTVDDNDGKIRITNVTFTKVADASGNDAVGSGKSPDKAYYIDTAGPTAETEAAVQSGGVNKSFYVPFTVTDAASGVAGLPGSLTVKNGDSTAKFQYAITATEGAPSDWSDGAFGTSIPFTQTGGLQRLYIQPVDKESYNFNGTAAVTFTLADYAGNTGTSTVTLTGVSLDTEVPTAEPGGSTRSYDNGASSGTLTVTISAADLGGLAAVQYQWSDNTTEVPTGEWLNAVGSLDSHPAQAEMTASATVASHETFRKNLWVRVTDAAGNSSVTNLGEYSYSLSAINYTLDYTAKISTAASVKVTSLDSGGKLVFDVRKGSDTTHYVKVVDSADANTNIFPSDWYTAAASGDSASGWSFTGMADAGSFLSGYTGNLYVTVYSGNDATITQASAGADIDITNNAGAASFALRVSAADNVLGDVFSGNAVFTADEATRNKLRSFIEWYPWYYGSGRSVSSTLEGTQLSINLGEDINGWDYADIDWDNSFIALYKGDTPNSKRVDLDFLMTQKLCGIGSGPSQTVTLPACSYKSGYYHLSLVLVRRSVNACYTAELPIGDNQFVNIDATEPGSLDLGLLVKESTDSTGNSQYEEITYGPDAPIYIPTGNYHVTLSVEAMDAAGNPVDYSSSGSGTGAYINAGAMDVIAWNTSTPETKISLSPVHLSKDTNGTISKDQDETPNQRNGKRLLNFAASTGGTYDGILGVTYDQDNIIALQVQYANGKSSAVTYLTVHPVSLNLAGTIAATPAVDESVYGSYDYSLVTADPGAASITFTPDSGTNITGLTLYCQEGYETSRSANGYIVYGSYGEEANKMTLQSDGSYVWQVPTADAAAYANTTDTDRYPGIFKPADNGYFNVLKDSDEKLPVGYYTVYAMDQYGNLSFAGIAENGMIADGSAPIISGTSLSAEDGAYTATFQIRDDSLYSSFREHQTSKVISKPMTLTLSYDDVYAADIGATGESLTLTADASGENYVWKTDSGNKLGIYEVDAVLTREGQFDGANDTGTYYKSATDVYLTVTVKGMVSPAITSATDMTLNLTATDAHGNKAEAVGVTASVTGVAPIVTKMEFNPIQQTPGISDLALFVTFNAPVQPAESWINRSISGYKTEWQDAFPITNDGTWYITFTDVFGTVYTIPVKTSDYNANGVFGKYGFDLSFSTLDYVPASQGVTITASYTGTDGGSLHIYKGNDNITTGDEVNRLVGRTAKAEENGDYTIYLYGDSGWTDKLHIYLNNIVSGGPEATLYFFLEEFKEEYAAGADDQFKGTTTAPVTVSYQTSRETSPVGDTTLTFKNGDNDSFTFQYYDVPTNHTYTISGKLSDYGITLAAPEEPYADTEAPTIDLVTVWTQRGSGFVQTEAFPGSAGDEAVKSAIENSGYTQGYDFVVNASDYSKWKVVVKSAAPTSIRYASAASDTIPGVEVQGNNVLVTKDVSSDFYIVVVDNAAADSAATADNFTCVRIPNGRYQFDTTAPSIETTTVANGLYSKTVYIRATDQDNQGADTSSSVTISGQGVVEERNTVGGVTYTHKLTFTENDTVVVVTATDAAGNNATANIRVEGIDVTAPTLSVTWSPCFKDPTTGRLDQSNPTAGPVNTDVVAHITSDKEIASVRVNDSITLDPNRTEYQDYWNDGGMISYTSQRITVYFKEEGKTSYDLEVFAPNGRSATTKVTLNDGVIDKTPPFVENLWNSYYFKDYVTIEELKRDDYHTPYAIRLRLADPYEDVYCMDSGTAGVAYNEDNPFQVVLTDNEEHTYLFSDKAGNLQEITIPAPRIDVLDSVAPEIELPDIDDSANATNGTVALNVTIYDETQITLTANDSSVECGSLTKGADSSGNTVWTGTVRISKNGTFRLTATDSAGNAKTVTFTINNIDRILPVISFDTSTVNLRQDSERTALDALLAVNSGSVHTWDNVEIADGTLTYDASGVDLTRAGIYNVTYSVQDTAGNEGQATRYVKVIDRNQPIITVDGALTEQNGVTSIKTGTHTLSVSGLKTSGEPYTLKLVKGLYSSGQMKRVSGGVEVGEDGSFTLENAGFYTLYLTTQSRQTYRTLLYVEK